MRPCFCDKPTCRLCYLFHHDPRYWALWSEPHDVDQHPSLIDHIYLINLKRRPDRLSQALTQCAKAGLKVHVWEATDGKQHKPQAGWRAGAGAFGCSLSHRAVIKDALEKGYKSWLTLEDDVVFVPDLKVNLARFLSIVPDDWDAVFLGGQHVYQPTKISDGLVKCVNCHRTHAYILRDTFAPHLLAAWEAGKEHVDHTFGSIQKKFNVYAPQSWLCGQSAGKSDISGMTNPEKFWTPRGAKATPCCGHKRSSFSQRVHVQR